MQQLFEKYLEKNLKKQLIRMIEQSPLIGRNTSAPTQDLIPVKKSSEDRGVCEICEKEFSNAESLATHMDLHINSDPNNPFRCDVCGKCFSVPARLARHYRTHTGEKPYNCTICHKSFSVKENLSVHLRIHTQDRPYQCSVCQRSFEHSGKLHRHMRIHTGERPHQCNICSKTFIQSGQLVIHMRTHTGEKPYVCTTCEKGFTCSKQLKVHMRTHTGEKPYSCDICGKAFGYNHVLKLHQMAHFGEKVYKCTICKSTFGTKKSLEIHIKTHNESLAESPSPRSTCPSVRSSIESSEIISIPPTRDSAFCKPRSSPAIPSSTSLPCPAPLAHSSLISRATPRNLIDSEFILPSINTICPGDPPSIDTFSPSTTRQRVSLIKRNPLYPVTPSLVKTLLEEDLATYGPPTPLRTPSLSPEIYGSCLVTPSSSEPSLTPPPSVSPPTSISMMTESSLPLRKRRMALSECSDSDDTPLKQTRPGSEDLPGSRSSVICFATRA